VRRQSSYPSFPALISPQFCLAVAINLAVNYFARKNRGTSVRLLDGIVVDFKRGIVCGVMDVAADVLAREEAATGWDRRDFFREGYALGLAALHALTLSRGNPEARNQAPYSFRIMHYTGYGFWNAFAKKARLPRIPNQPSSWAGVPDYTHFRPFITGGEAFGRLVLTRKVTPRFLSDFEARDDPVSTLAAWHGCGRALWFRWTGDVGVLMSLLYAYPPATVSLAVGLGMAITFTQIAYPNAVGATIGCFSAGLRRYLATGAGVALAGMVTDNPAERARVFALYGGPLHADFEAALVAAERARVQTETAPENWYAAFFERLGT
jgi:hypothetical protein